MPISVLDSTGTPQTVLTLDDIAAQLSNSALVIDGVEYTVKRAAIGVNTSGENTIVAAVASKKIRVLSLNLIAAAAVSLYANNATTGAIWGGSTNKVALAANGGLVLPHNPYGWFETGTNNEALRFNLSSAVAVAGSLTYIEV